MPENKRHHYVPKFLLRQFSEDRARIDVCRISDNRVFSNVSLKDQSYKNYYYGRSSELEKAFSSIEGEARLILEKILLKGLDSLSDEENTKLRFFVVLQSERTPGAAKQVQALTAEMGKTVIEAIARSNDIPQDFVNKVKLEMTEPQMAAIQSAANAFPVTIDLSIKLLVANEGAGYFMLSDNPVSKCNQFVEHHPDLKNLPGGTGYAQVGLQIFLPISPLHCLCLYDPGVYEYGSAGSSLVHASKKDIGLINLLQVGFSEKCVYWSQGRGPDEVELERLISVGKVLRDGRVPSSQTSDKYQKRDGSIGQLTITNMPSVRIGKKFSFVRVSEKRRIRSGFIPYRSPEIIEMVEAERMRKHGPRRPLRIPKIKP